LVYNGGPPTAINAILAIIADGRRWIVVIDREAEEIIFFLLFLLILLKPFNGGLSQPILQRLPGVVYAQSNQPCRWRGKCSIMVGMLLCLCFASQNPSERECFVPIGKDLAVKLLINFL
jgi:hypothetical protein